MILSKWVLLLGTAVVLSACDTSIFDPSKDWQKFEHERVTANQKPRILAEDGTLPKPEPVAGAVPTAADLAKKVDEKYAQFCVLCHGADGKAQTDAGKALAVHPRDFTDAEWQKNTPDSEIAKVIKDGGASIGKSPFMAAWGAMISDDELPLMVKKVRSFSGKK